MAPVDTRPSQGHNRGMGRTWRDLLAHYFDTRGIAWQVPGLIVAVVIIGAVVGGWLLRDALSDFLTADVKVWHLLLAVGVSGVGGFILMRIRRPSSLRERATWPREIDLYGVKWPITASRSGSSLRFKAGMPQCPECRTPLGLDSGEGMEPMQLSDDQWKKAGGEELAFRCRKHGAYDLTEYKLGMGLLTRNVEAEAQGKYSTALATEEQK